MNPQPLPQVKTISDYQKYLYELKKNHFKAIEHLKKVRSRASEFERNAGNGFITFKELAIGACNHQSVRMIDNGESKSRVNKIPFIIDGNSFHKINSILDAIIEQMENEEPIVSPPASGVPSIPVNLSQTQTQNQSQQMVLEIQDYINTKMKEYKDGSDEKNFLEKIKNSLGGVLSVAQLIGLIIRTGHELGFTIDKIAGIFK